MKKSLSLGLLVFLLAAPLIAPVYATQPAPVEGNFEILIPRTDGCEILGVHGFFEGTLAECLRASHGASVGYFEGTAGGYEGTLVFNLVPFGRNELGQWTILTGTGDLANLRGKGLSYIDGTYDGQVHFDP